MNYASLSLRFERDVSRILPPFTSLLPFCGGFCSFWGRLRPAYPLRIHRLPGATGRDRTSGGARVGVSARSLAALELEGLVLE